MAIEKPTNIFVTLTVLSFFGLLALERFLSYHHASSFLTDSDTIKKPPTVQYSTLAQRLKLQHIAKTSGILHGQRDFKSSMGTSETRNKTEHVPPISPPELPSAITPASFAEGPSKEKNSGPQTVSPSLDKIPSASSIGKPIASNSIQKQTSVSFAIRSSDKSNPGTQTTSATLDKRQTTSPSLDKRQTTSPSLDKRQTTSPTLDKRQTTSPTLDKRQTTSPSLDKHQTTSPSLDKRQTTSPSLDKHQTTSPSLDKRQTTSPTLDKRQTTSPTLDKRQTTSPTLDKRQTTSPTPDKRQTTSLTPDKRQTSSPTLDKRQTTSPTLDKRQTTSPTLDKRQTTSPTPEKRQTTSPTLDKRPRLPKALIIGFSKCGTAALQTFLTIHPDVVSPVLELRYFTMNFSKGPEWYRKQMPPSTKNQLTIEKTPSYILTNQYLKRIHDFNPKFKLLAIVRDPIVRLQSQYAHAFCNTEPSKRPSFRDYWGEKLDNEIARSCHYAKYIRKVYNFFPKKQLLVLNEDAMERDPLPVWKEAEKFLELRPAYSDDMFVFNKTKDFYCFNTHSKLFPRVLTLVQVNNVTGCLGKSKGREHPPIGRDYLEILKQIIRPLNEDLFDLIGKRFQWENFRDKS